MQLDLTEMNYILKHGPGYTPFPVIAGQRKRFLRTLREALRVCYRAIAKPTTQTEFKKLAKPILLYAGTANQLKSIIPIANSLKDQYDLLIGPSLETTALKSLEEAERCIHVLPKGLRLKSKIELVYRTILHLPQVYADSDRYGGELGISYICQCWRALEGYVRFKQIIQKSDAQWLLTANDHNASNRVLYFLARKNSKKTAYVQHAMVSHLFPPLEFTIAFLDGAKSEQVYEKNAATNDLTVNTKVLRVGCIKELGSREFPDRIESLGIATNLMTPFDAIKQIIETFGSKPSLQLYFRLHPGEDESRRNALSSLVAKFTNMSISSKDETVATFLDKCDAVAAGNSSILLETAIGNRVPVSICELGGTSNCDYYGFIKEGLSRQIKLSADFGAQVESWRMRCSQPAYQNLIRQYSASFRTPTHAKEGKVIARELLQSLQ